MSRIFIIALLVSLLLSCREKAKEEIKIDPAVKCLSAFMFGSRSDTIRKFAFTTYLFKKDSFLVLKPDSLYHWNTRVYHLDSTDIRKVNKMLKAIEFESYLNNTIYKEIYESRMMYCGPWYGFIDSSGHVETFVPFGKERIIENIFSYLRDKKSEVTTDTVQITNYMHRVKRKYLKDRLPIPVLEEVKFVPPVIH